MAETIFALSSGSGPAAIGVIRVSGPMAGAALTRLAGALPVPRRASLRRLRDEDCEALDSALVLWHPGPATATGEDLVELHCHGGRAVVTAVEAALARMPGLRRADPGEFTRRAFANGRIDLAEAEGLADLLAAETELQRRNALSLAGGALSRRVASWRDEVLAISALIEAVLDFGDEDDIASATPLPHDRIDGLAQDLRTWLATPSAELLRDGLRVVIAGPPNAGKSALFNALIGADAAIVSPIAGTTRDVVSRPISLGGVAFVFVDTAGLRHDGDDEIERIGIDRARSEIDAADIVLWLGSERAGDPGFWEIDPRVDEPGHRFKACARHRVSARTGEGLIALIDDLIDTGRAAMPRPGEVAVNHRQRSLLEDAHAALVADGETLDPLIIAEHLRGARLSLDRLSGRTSTDDVLDTLFSRFCIGK